MIISEKICIVNDRDEELLAKGLELNDGIQNELAKHDAIAAGHPLPTQVMSPKPQLTEVPSSSPKGDEGNKFSSSPPVVPSSVVPSAPSTVVINAIAEEEEEEDEFAQLARRLVLLTRFTITHCMCTGSVPFLDLIINILFLYHRCV